MIRIQNGKTERILVTALDNEGTYLINLTDILLEIKRKSDGFYFDFNDDTFKSSGWTTRQNIMTELDSTNSPGTYSYTFNTVGLNDDEYYIRASSILSNNSPWEAELKVGDYVDHIDAPISIIDTTVDTVLSDVQNHRLEVEAKITNILGLSNQNIRIFTPAYDTNNNLTSATIKIYPTATDTNNNTNVLKSYIITATYNTQNNMTSYKVVEA